MVKDFVERGTVGQANRTEHSKESMKSTPTLPAPWYTVREYFKRGLPSEEYAVLVEDIYSCSLEVEIIKSTTASINPNLIASLNRTAFQSSLLVTMVLCSLDLNSNDE